MEHLHSGMRVTHAEAEDSGHFAQVMKAIQRLLERGEINYRQAAEVMHEQADKAAKKTPKSSR